MDLTWIYNHLFALKMDTLLPQTEKIPFFDTELLNLHCLLSIKSAVQIDFVMPFSFFNSFGLLYNIF